MKLTLKISSILMCLTTFSFSANATRWFEIELIAFDQKPSETLREDFKLEHKQIKTKGALSIIEEGLNRQEQLNCLDGDKRFDPRLLSQQLVASNSSWECKNDRNYIGDVMQLPITPFAEPLEHMDSIYLLSSDQLKFDEIINKLKRKGLHPMLHTGWRFPEMSSRKASKIKLIAGKKVLRPTSYRAIDNIENHGYISLLGEQSDKQELMSDFLWQVEGLIKIHVRHYLFVTTDLDINFLDDDGELQQARMSQYTRVYSGDIHYLDHPKLGIIFQIRKYKH